MASTWAATASNETISFTTLQNGVDTGVLSQKAAIPISNEQITKTDANTYVNIDTSFGPYASKASNQLVVKSNLQSTVSVTNTSNLLWAGIANNEIISSGSQVQLIAGWDKFPPVDQGRILKSIDFGVNYFGVLEINDNLYGIKFMPSFRHPSYLSVEPFLAAGENGRIVTNTSSSASSWITISSPTTQDLYDITFNSSVGIIVGDQRIIKTNTNNRINSWSIVNSVASRWRSAASDGSRFVAVGDNNAIIVGDSLGTTWSVRSMPPLVPSKQLTGVTFHTDSFFYAVGYDTANPSLAYLMRSSDSGFNWSTYTPTGDSFIGGLYSINSIGGRLVIGGINFQYQIINNVVTRYGASVGGVDMRWVASVRDPVTNGFDMAGQGNSTTGAYSNF